MLGALRALVLVAAAVAALAMAVSADARPLVWEHSGGPEGGWIDAIAVDPVRSHVVYARVGGGVFRSADGGMSWARSDEGLGDLEVLSLAVDPTRPGVVYAGVEREGLFRSADEGASWTPTAPLSGEASELSVAALAVDRSSGRVFAGTETGLFVSDDGVGAWRQLSPDLIRSVSAIAVGGGLSGAVYAIDTFRGWRLLRSDDGGENWFATPDSNRPKPPNVLVADPSHPGTVYMGGAFGLFKTTDRGVTWNGVNIGLPRPTLRWEPADVRGLAIDPADPRRLLLGLTRSSRSGSRPSGGVYVSKNGGEIWRRDGAWLQTATVEALAFPGSGRALAGTPEGMYQRRGGGDWRLRNSGLIDTSVQALATHPARAPIAYAASSNGGEPGPGGRVFASGGARAAWTLRSRGLEGELVSELVIDPRAPRTMYAATRNGVFKTTNAGGSWRPASRGLPSLFGSVISISALALDSHRRDTLYAGTELRGVFKSTNGGRSWRNTGGGIRVSADALAVDPRRPNTVYAGTGDDVFKTTTGGRSWRRVSRGLPRDTAGVQALVIDPSNPRRLYVAIDGDSSGASGGLFRSTNGGTSWKPINRGLRAFSKGDYSALLIDPRTPRILYTAVSGDLPGATGGVFRTTNRGRTWKPITRGLSNTDVLALAISRDASTLYGGTRGSGALTLSLR